MGKRESASIASEKSEFELVRRTLGAVGQRRMSVEADLVWRIVAAASVAAIYRTLPRGAQPSRQRQSDPVSFADGGKKEQGSSAVSTTTGRPAEVLPEGSGIKVDGTAGDWPTINTYIKDAGNPSQAQDLPGLIYHQRAQSNEFLLRAVTGTSFLTIRVLYWTNRRSPNLCKSCLLTFAGKLDFGCVGAMSAIDLSILSSTGVARKAWVSPVCGPLSTVAIPTICPRSLIWLAMVG